PKKEFHPGKKALLLRSSPVWQGPSRAEFLSLGQNSPTAAPAENVVVWLDLLRDETKSRRYTDPNEDLISTDAEVMRHAWHLLSSIYVNPRMFSRVMEIGEFIENSAGITLVKPAWSREVEPSNPASPVPERSVAPDEPSDESDD